METTLVASDGSIAWSHKFKGSGFSANFLDGFSSAARQAMTEILNHMVLVLATDEFRRSLAPKAMSERGIQ